MKEEKPWWFPTLVDDAFLVRLREDYPEKAHLDDYELKEYFECNQKYETTWDHLGDAYEEYEKLADAYLELLNRIGP